MCSCSLIFPLLLVFTLVAASISHFLTAPFKFSCFCSNKIGLLCFLSLAVRLFLFPHPPPGYMKGWMYALMIFSEPKFLGYIDNHIFLPMVLCCASMRESSATTHFNPTHSYILQCTNNHKQQPSWFQPNTKWKTQWFKGSSKIKSNTRVQKLTFQEVIYGLHMIIFLSRLHFKWCGNKTCK